MKEIGSIFPLSSDQILKNRDKTITLPKDRIYYSLCREAFTDIAQHRQPGNKIVLVPAYTCQTVISPFDNQGWLLKYYSVNRDLRIDVEDLKNKAQGFKPSIIIAHPYFGMDLTEAEDSILKDLQKNGIKIIVDLTQCLFSKHDYGYVDYIVGSLRKWFPIPDGGYLITNEKGFTQPLEENSSFTEYQTEAMYLRGMYFHNHDVLMKEISIKLNKTADRLAEQYSESHRISDLSYNLLSAQDTQYNPNQRLINFQFLYSNIPDGIQVKKTVKDLETVTSAPLYFTVFVSNRKELQTVLAQNSIYAPVLWPVEDDRVLINEDIQYIYSHLLAIPCDQRYDTDDMKRIVAIINEFNEKN